MDTEEARGAALEAADRDIYAASSTAPYASRIKLLHKALALCEWKPLPPSAAEVRALGAVLKDGEVRLCSGLPFRVQDVGRASRQDVRRPCMPGVKGLQAFC